MCSISVTNILVVIIAIFSLSSLFCSVLVRVGTSDSSRPGQHLGSTADFQFSTGLFRLGRVLVMASTGASFVAVASASAGEDFAADFQVAAALSRCAVATLAGLQLAPLLGPYAPGLRAEDLVHPGPQRRGAGLAHHAHHGETLEVIAVPRSTSEAALCHHGVADRGLPGADSSAVQHFHPARR